MNLSERKIVNMFKSFIERVFVPQLPKMDLSCQQEWNKFANMMSSDQITLGEIQLYVDTLPSSTPTITRPNFNPTDNKPTFFTKTKKEPVEDTPGSFNPSKTFGPERARMMFPLKDFDEPPADRQNYNFSKDFSKDKQEGFSGISTQTVLPTLERLFKMFAENQSKMQKVGNPSSYEPKAYYS